MTASLISHLKYHHFQMSDVFGFPIQKNVDQSYKTADPLNSLYICMCVCVCVCMCVCLFAISKATSVAYGGSQARGPIGAAATSLCHSHSNMGSEPCLQCTPQLTAMPDP